MRPHLLLLPIIFCAVVYAIFSSAASDSPADEARTFLTRISNGDIEGTLREFGDNTCHCAPKGGYVAYLRYEDAQDPSLAFLMGQKFSFVGEPKVKQLPFNNEKYVLPWDKPEDVSVRMRIEFPEQARPYFIPMDTAFGYEVPESEMKHFAQDPTDHWARAFTLRLRPSLSPGLVKQPDPKARHDDEEAEKTVDESLLPPEVTKYMHPHDAAPIKLASGNDVPAATFANQMPRLAAITVGMKIVRRGSFRRWTVKKLGVEDPLIVADGKQIQLH